MKKMICEMCGSGDLLKQDGVFVCQSCGTKYTVEEAKKMMVEVEGAVSVKNAAQLENLLNLAHSSFDSKNYSQAEDFCNQVIAMDDKNYDAWKLKGEAINYQINSNNPRILEAYNCIMTAYRLLDEERKNEKKHEILALLKICLEGEVDFWIKQFEAQRPSDITLAKVKNSYNDSYNKMSSVFDELSMSNSKKDYLINFDNLFIDKINAICTSAWKTTVGYNYYRDDFATLGKDWGRASAWSNLVSTNTDSYRPLKKTWETFLIEGDCLVSLLKFAETRFNGKTVYQTKKNVYENIIYIEEKLIDSVSYKIGTSGYSVGWCEDFSLTDEAKSLRQEIIDSYNNKLDKAKTSADKEKRVDIMAANQGKNANELIKIAYNHLNKNKIVEADAVYDSIIKLIPDEIIGYIGKSVVKANDEDGCSYEELFTPMLNAKNKKRSAEYEAEVKKLVDFASPDEYGTTLLMHACSGKMLDAVQLLVELGADVNKKSKHNTTALWYVCYKALYQADAEDGKAIARLLLEKGASAHVINDGGVALYNKNTDPGVARILKKYYPDLHKGEGASESGSGGGCCYVATAVYGSYDCPEVWTLRRFRDDTLSKTWYGRAFVKTYYAISPTIVKWFGETEWFKKLWRGTLDRMVAGLQAKGVESTPYEDKEW